MGLPLLFYGTWRSSVAHLNGVQGVAGSNPAVPIVAPQLEAVGASLSCMAETQAGRPDSAGSRSEDASGAVGGRQNRRFEPSVGEVLEDRHVLRETTGDRRRRSEVNPAGAGNIQGGGPALALQARGRRFDPGWLH